MELGTSQVGGSAGEAVADQLGLVQTQSQQSCNSDGMAERR